MPSVGSPHRPTHHTQCNTANASNQISLETITDPFGGHHGRRRTRRVHTDYPSLTEKLDMEIPGKHLGSVSLRVDLATHAAEWVADASLSNAIQEPVRPQVHATANEQRRAAVTSG